MEDIFNININYIEDVEIKELYIMEIYDNEILDLIKFKNLRKLDCSFNRIRKIINIPETLV